MKTKDSTDPTHCTYNPVLVVAWQSSFHFTHWYQGHSLSNNAGSSFSDTDLNQSILSCKGKNITYFLSLHNVYSAVHYIVLTPALYMLCSMLYAPAWCTYYALVDINNFWSKLRVNYAINYILLNSYPICYVVYKKFLTEALFTLCSA